MKRSEDYLEQAHRAFKLAETLGTGRPFSGRDFLENMSLTDQSVDHDGSTCGVCHYAILGAEVAREMLRSEQHGEHVIKEWAEEVRRRWESSKFVLLWQEEVAAGRDPHAAFKERGWEP